MTTKTLLRALPMWRAKTSLKLSCETFCLCCSTCAAVRKMWKCYIFLLYPSSIRGLVTESQTQCDKLFNGMTVWNADGTYSRYVDEPWYRTTPCLKTVQNCFCQNFIKFPPILIIFGRKMTKRLKLCEVHSFSTSPISRHHTSVLNADVRNCYIMLKVICNKLSNDLISTQ